MEKRGSAWPCGCEISHRALVCARRRRVAESARRSSWYRAAAELGHVEAQYQLGLICLRGDKVGSSEPALVWLEAASSYDQNAAREALQLIFPNGLHVEPDIEEGARWIRAAAQAGKPEAHLILADLLRHGRGCEKNEQTALRCLLLAAEHGLASAAFAVGDVYFQGQLGMTSDVELAARLV